MIPFTVCLASPKIIAVSLHRRNTTVVVSIVITASGGVMKLVNALFVLASVAILALIPVVCSKSICGVF